MPQCENTEHINGAPENNVIQVKLTSDFDGELCWWCEDCRDADSDMIDYEIEDTGPEIKILKD